jgi:hypothetical protein
VICSFAVSFPSPLSALTVPVVTIALGAST